MRKIFVSTIILMLFMFPFSIAAKAETTQDINDFKEFDSFMKRYHEHSTELVYFVSNSYDSNEHYWRENFDLFREVVGTVYDTNKNEHVNAYLESAENLFAKPIALFATVNDLRRKVFEKIKGFFSDDELIDYGYVQTSHNLSLPDGYFFKAFFKDINDYAYFTSMSNQKISGMNGISISAYNKVNNTNSYLLSDTFSDNPELYQYYYPKLSTTDFTIKEYMELAERNNIVLTITDSMQSGNELPIYSQNVPQPINNVINNIVDGLGSLPKELEDYTPTVQPMLVCPSETVPLTYQEGTFKTSTGQLVTISEDETANYLETLCNLDFKFPEIYYHEDTQKLIVGGEDFSPSTLVPVPAIDNGLVEYVRNSYNYATSVINSGVNGLKSIVAGTAGLVTFSGSLFGFLPPEILTLFIGGFSIALGLWVFKK